MARYPIVEDDDDGDEEEAQFICKRQRRLSESQISSVRRPRSWIVADDDDDLLQSNSQSSNVETVEVDDDDVQLSLQSSNAEPEEISDNAAAATDDDDDGETEGSLEYWERCIVGGEILPVVLLNDLDIFDCLMCANQLLSPVFQCENGHIACSSCCSKLERKCPFCCMPIGSGNSRCRGLEKFIESINISCKYACSGCEEIMPYSQKIEHEEVCPHITCFCSYPSCDYTDCSGDLYFHIGLEHKDCTTRFTYNTTFSVSIEMHQKQIYLQQQRKSVVFILNHQVQEHGQRVLNVVCIGHSSFKNKFEYQLTVESMDTSLTLKSVPEMCTQLSKHTPVKSYLTVPSEFAGYNGLLSVSVCIKECISSDPEAEGNWRYDSDAAGKVLKVGLTDPDVLDCSICREPLWTPVFQCENSHLACSSCCFKQKSKCPCCSHNYNRCRGLEKVIESICRVSCKNAKYGCKEMMRYSKKSKHERKCPRAKFFCPHPSCPFTGFSEDLCTHFGIQHGAFVTRFDYDTTFSVCVDITQKHVFLQEHKGSVIFILNHEVQDHGRVFYVDCVGTSELTNKYIYQLTVKSMGTSQFYKVLPDIYTKWSKHVPTQNYLTVPSDFAGYNGSLYLSICIKKDLAVSLRLLRRRLRAILGARTWRKMKK